MQEAFESKQATMFVAIDKLFALHNAMLFESRVIIAFLVYSVAIFIVYMLTSIKHAYNVRHRLYLGMHSPPAYSIFEAGTEFVKAYLHVQVCV